MIINEAGEYTLQYTATDACGNSTTVERDLVVEAPPTYRTVLYTDGTFIINESSVDEAANVQAHGQPTNIYPPYDADHPYDFNQSSQYWNSEKSLVLHAEIGSNISPTVTKYWFGGMTNVVDIDLSKLDTSNVSDMQYMFNSCGSLESIDISNFNFQSTTSMRYMFRYCSSLKSIDMSGVTCTNNLDVERMFENCTALEQVDFTGASMPHITAIKGLFKNCSVIESVDLSAFRTSAVTSFHEMFANCSAIKNINFANIDTANVTTFETMFRYCEAIETIDVSGFNTSSATNMKQMFNFCRAVKTIYASSNFVTSQVTESTGMFSACSTNLVGGAGTVWSSSYTDKTRAKIDGGVGDEGYFTARP